MPTNDEHVSGVKISTFPSAQSIDSPDLVTGLKNNNGIVTNANFTFSTILAWVRQRISEFYIPLSARGQANGVASLNESGKIPVGQIPSSNATPEMDGVGGAGSALAYARSDHRHPSDTSKISTSLIGAASGVASLGSDGKVPSAQLPTIPSASSATPQDLGTAAAGSSTDYSRADHVHNKPTYDATPTANSTNPVQSGGVYTDVRTRVPNYGKGKSLLRNWYFVNPVNQRGLSSYTGIGYGIDGWKGRNYNTQVMVSSDGLKLNATASGATGILDQTVDNQSDLLGKPVTLSAVVGGLLETHTVTMPSSYSTGYIITGSKLFLGVESDGSLYVRFTQSATWQLLISAVKLELGSEQTLAHQENGVWVLNEIPDYEYELYRCITSTADPSDTYANKSLATEQQLAVTQVGPKANRAYAANSYFCWNGLLYRVTTAISNGADLTINTNCVQTTVMDEIIRLT